jgi:hypothetical protein
METSTKVMLAGFAALCGLSLYSKKSNGSYNPFALVGNHASGPALPTATPKPSVTPAGTKALPGAPPGGLPSNTPEVNAAINALQSVPAAFPNSPEAKAAVNTLQSFPPNSPEAQAALNALQAFPTSPEAQAALDMLKGVPVTLPPSNPGSGVFDGHGTGLLDEPLIKNGDVVDVDMFRSGMAIPQGVPAVGLIFMNVDSLESGAPDKFLASFVSPEFRIFGPQLVNRSAIVKKA